MPKVKIPLIEETTKSLLKDAARKLTGSKRRAFEAKTVLDLYDGHVYKAEVELGWGRTTIKKGLRELATGIECIDDYQSRGRHKSEVLLPNLEADIRSLVDPYSQTDPYFKSCLVYTRITAKSVREGLIKQKRYQEEVLPGERAMLEILNRLGYTLKSVQKTKPKKKSRS